MAEHALYFADQGEARKYKIKQIVLKTLVYLFLTVFALFMLLPFVFMIITSFNNYFSHHYLLTRLNE